MESHKISERDIDIDDVVNAALDQSAQVALPPYRARSPRSAVRVATVICYGDDRVELETDGLDEVIVGSSVSVPGWTQHDVNSSKEVGDTVSLD